MRFIRGKQIRALKLQANVFCVASIFRLKLSHAADSSNIFFFHSLLSDPAIILFNSF